MKNIGIRFLVGCGIISFFPVFLNAQVSEYNYATGNVKGRNHVGGLIGKLSEKDGKAANSFARGSVTGETNVGGFAGSNNGTVENSYSTGKVTGNSDMGGFAGSGSGTSNNSYWDMQTSSATASAGGTGKKTAAMTYPYAAGTYSDWNFNNIWKADQAPAQNNGYPLLLPTNVYRLDLRIVPAGSGTVSGAGYYKASQQVQVTATPGQLYVFKGWVKGSEIMSTQLQYALPFSAHTTLVAQFESKSTAADNNLSLIKPHFAIYPNPVNDVLRIDASGLSGKVKSYFIINIVGQVIKSYKADNSGNRTSFVVADLKPGMYFLKANLGKEFVLEKFIKN